MSLLPSLPSKLPALPRQGIDSSQKEQKLAYASYLPQPKGENVSEQNTLALDKALQTEVGLLLSPLGTQTMGHDYPTPTLNPPPPPC